jgi:hypothetical protein
MFGGSVIVTALVVLCLMEWGGLCGLAFEYGHRRSVGGESQKINLRLYFVPEIGVGIRVAMAPAGSTRVIASARIGGIERHLRGAGAPPGRRARASDMVSRTTLPEARIAAGIGFRWPRVRKPC